MHRRSFVALVAALAVSGPFNALAQDAVSAGRQEARDVAKQGLADLYAAAPATRAGIESAVGYGVFSTVGLKLLFAGGTRGSGVVFNNRTKAETFMKMLQVQGGLGFGVARNTVIFVFTTESALRQFIGQGWEVSGQGNLAAAASSEGGSLAGAVSIAPGVYIYQITDTGLAATLTIAGTKFFKDDELN